MSNENPPISIISYNRPDYFQQTLDSLAKQTGINMQERSVYLFQDFDCVETQNSCIQLFRKYFPMGTVLAASKNLGVGLNILRAETFFFKELKVDCAYFFEDDIVLVPHYVHTLDNLKTASASNKRIGYFACYGNSRLSAEVQSSRSKEITHIDFLWGFGLFRNHWEVMQPFMEVFYKIIRNCEYHKRPHAEIYKACWDAGILVTGSSQDDVKKAVLNKLGYGGINTVLANARNIGRIGVHSRHVNFEKIWNNQTLLDHTQVDLDFPNEDRLTEIIHKFKMSREKSVLEKQQKFMYK